MLLGLPPGCGEFGYLLQPFFLLGTLFGSLLSPCSFCPSLTFLSRRPHDAAVVSPGVESPVHPVPEASCEDATGSRVGHPLAVDELPVCSTVREAVDSCDEISDRPAGGEVVVGQGPQVFV